MQHNDGAQQQEGRISTTPSSIAALSAITTSHPAVSQLRVAGRVPVVTAAPAIGVVAAAGQQGVLTTVAGARPVAMSPQAVMVPTQTVSRLLSPSTSLSANTVQIPATLNVLQRQLSAPGVVGLSAVSAQDLQQVLQQASQQSITLLTATEAVAEPQQRPRLARPLSFPHSSPSLPAVSSMSATGATIHHHGQSPVRGAVPVMAATLSHSNLQHSLLGMSLNPQQQQQLSAAQRRVVTTTATTTTTTTSAIAVIPAANITAQSRTVFEVRAPSGQPPSLRTASGAPPRKKMRLEEKPPPNAEVGNYRKQLIELKHKQMKEIKLEYFENLTEAFFLQSGQNLMDFHSWKKRPTPQLVTFLTTAKLDSDEEEDVLQVKEINSEVKVLTNPGSNVPLATPVAISTTLPPMVSALSQQVVAPSAQTASAGSTTTLSATASQAIASSSSSATVSSTATTTSQLQQQLSKALDSRTAVKGSLSSLKQIKSPPMSPGQRLHTRQQSLSAVYDNISGSSQEVIVERAKQEAQVVQRVAELRKEGLWSSKRLPRVQEPPRQKAHWDYLLEEMTWLAADFIQERKWKKAAARKVARMVSNYFKEQEQKELKAEKEEASKLKKIASHMAKMVKEFWSNIERVVQYKQQMRLDEKKKRALDLHLNFIVDQTEKYSTWLTEGLQNASSVNGSVSTSPSHSSDGEDFEPSENSTDDEETIQKEEDEAGGNELEEKQELEDLQKEGDLSLEELLKTLPQEVLDAPAPLPPPLPEGMEDMDSDDDENMEEEGKEAQKEETGEKEGSKSSDDKEAKEEGSGDKDDHKDGSDKEFSGTEEDAMDVEDTIDEQEKQEKRDYHSELQDLAEEGEMSIEELAAKYAGAYDSDFEMPQESSSEEEEDDSELESDEFEIETGSSSEEAEQKEEESEEKEESPGLEALMKPPQDPSPSGASTSATAQAPGVKKEEKEEVINDIAAQALSLQPKGYTLETTEVKTKVPFLLKHKLREYQHVGLDWLATMHDKRLNGILADEMGLGKTIQTIALLAHLACEKGTWGPHLIVVPTSVMLNWEMELKKWCPAFKILTYYGNLKERKAKRQGWTKTNAFHVCITSYKLVVQDHQAFRRKKWKYLILDEAQNIKNFKSQRWQMLLNFSSQRRLLLTGTPLQNSLMELWSLMHFLMPHVFQSHRDFKEWFANPLTGMIEGSQEYNESLIKRLHKVLRPFLLRRLKNEVEKQMPQKYEHVVMCRLSKRQRFLYDDFMSQTKTKETLASGHYMSVINILMQLRKVCNHPNLFDPRPVVSPLCIEGLTYSTASAVTTALQKDPLEEVDMRTLFPNLAEMERDLPAFVAHRVKQLTTSAHLIEEVDYHADPPPPLPKGQLKPGAFPMTASLLQVSGRASPVTQGRAGSPVEAVKTAAIRSATPPVLAVPRPVSSQSSMPSTSTPLSLTTVSSAPMIVPATAAVMSTAAVMPVSQVRSSSGQTLLLTSVTPRTGVSSALVLTSTTPSAAVTAATGISSPAVASTSTTLATPLPSTLQAKVLPQPSQGSSASGSSAVLSTQPITVQIQQTNQGTRLMIPTGQLTQLPANLFQIVQTSSGQHLVATSTATSSLSAQVSAVLPVTSTASTVNGPSTLTTVAATGGQGLVTTAVSQLKTLTALTTTSPATTTTTPSSSTVSTACSSSSMVVSSSGSKPVMRVSPIVASTSSGAVTTVAAPSTTTTTSSALPLSVVSSVVSTLKSVMSPKKRSELFLEPVYEKRKRQRREKLKRLARVTAQHCSQTPVYGPDLIQTLNMASEVCSQCHRERHWLWAGHANCQCVHVDHNRNLPRYYWHETNHLSDLIRTPEQYLSELKDVVDRFAFCVPTVISPGIQLRVAHPDPSAVLRQKRLEFDIREQLRPVLTRLNDLRMRMSIQFPELRLIQYDCGKLQTMDVLLRDLKSGGHRVLIFTQMTKMLDVLEAFLNHHGHRYLRLDGTTRVEQRQALMDRFNADKRIFCFILSTRSGGIGVNLTGADTVIFYDSDWNPTMDAQAQDRCHRIGQTRDVHIYRLISEMTVEENILKKANQKRLLGDLAIEGGNFTTAFFKEQTIKDLFAQPSGLKSLTEEKEVKEVKASPEESVEMEVEAPPAVAKKPGGKDKEANIVAAFEQALCKAEDETDAIAATLVKAEQKAELADFDESIPWDEKEAEAKKEEEEMSRAEIELAMLDKELSGIERYAVALMETQMEDDVMEELKIAEEDMENSKKDWELTRLKALKEEEERRARIEEDEMLYTYLRDEAQIFINELDGSEMPIWMPPTPPQDDHDMYVDPTMSFLYESSIMPESQLPPVYVRKDHRKPRVETITTRKQKQRKEEAPQVPRSLFDRPSSALVKMRRELKMQRLKAAGLGIHQKQPMRPTSLPAPLSHKAPMVEQSEGHPEWLIHEDWALLQAVSDCCHLPLNLTGYQNGHIPNWDLVADVVNNVSRTYRSIKQCRARYENVIIPREEGRILYDISPRKQKKNKSTYKTKNNRPMKTSQLFTQDNSNSVTLLFSLRFDSIKSMAGKRPAPTRQTLNNPSMKNPKHLAVLQENNINYDQPLTPLQVAAIRAERIQREKKATSAASANAEAAQRPAQANSGGVGERAAVQAVGGVAASAPTVAQAVAGQQLHSLVSATTPTSIIAGAATPRTAMAQGMTAVSIARTLAATGNIVAVTGSLGRGRVQVHDITTVAGTVQGAQVAAQTARATLQPTATAPANITQKMAAMAGTSALAGGTVHQQIAKGLNQQQINLLHPIMRSQAPGSAQQAQQLGHKVRFTKQAVVRTMPGITDEQLKALKVRQLQHKAQGGQQVKLQAAQILQGQMQQVGQSGSAAAAPVTLVKSVSAPTGASAVPIPVSINVTMAQGQQKTALPSRGPTVSQLQHQRMQLLQQRKGVPLQQSHRVTALGGVRSGQIPLLMTPKTQLTGQLLHQYIKQQPAIISVSQAQTLTPTMVAKVSLPHSTPIHTLAAGSPITVTQVAATTPSAGGSGAPSHHTPTVATINMANVSAATHATVVKTATLATVDPSQAQQGTKIATLAQSLVTPQPLQIASSALQPAQAATLVGAGGTQHRVLTATPTTLPQATTVVVSTASLTQSSVTTTTTVLQQQQPAQIVSAAAVVSAQAVPSPSAMATVVTQTQSPQGPSTTQATSTQLTAQQQQQLQKASPYTMRTRNQPKHS